MADAVEGLILQPSYRVRNGGPVVHLHGALEGGGAFVIEDDRFRPYFFLREIDVDALAGETGVRVTETDLRNLRGEPVVRVEVDVPSVVPPLRERLAALGVIAMEADVRFAYRYLIDHGIRASVRIEGKSERLSPALVRFWNPELRPGTARPELRVLSMDLETTLDTNQVLSTSLVCRDVEEVHIAYRRAVRGAIVHADEGALLDAVMQRIRLLDPDVITGWNVVDFDLRVFVRRCEALGLRAEIGRVKGGIGFQQDLGFTRQSRADVPGRQVLDGIPLVRDALRLADYRLETVAQAVLGKGKLIDAEAPDAGEEIQRLYREDPEALAAYNLEDSRLVLEILEHEGLLDLALERSLLSGMQLDRVGASIASFDLLYLPELRARGVVAPSVDRNRTARGVVGGAVLDSEPGVFENVAVFDFKSLYPSLIRTFNLDPLAHARATEGALEAPNGALFSRDEAILPPILERFMERREEAKRRGDSHADQAIKIMMNALFGVLGSVSCRFFDPAVANAITRFGQQTLAWTQEAFEDAGVRVIYGDTDSVFVQLVSRGDTKQAKAEADRLRVEISERVMTRVRREYQVEPRLVLELEKVFERFFMPRVRGGRAGSKKRYAGQVEGRLEIVGLESVRRDWPAVNPRQKEGKLVRHIPGDDVLGFVQEVIQRVRSGELDSELVYRKRIRKGALENYKATNAPHIQAARKAGGGTRGVIRYVITRQGPEPVFHGRPLPEGIDRAHYLERVLRPVADAILSELGQSFDEALGEPRQLSLL